MKSRIQIGCVLFFALLVVPASYADETTKVGGRFGEVRLYQTTARPAHVILFVGGDGGWNRGAVIIASRLASTDSLVVGADIVPYLQELKAARDRCLDPANDLVKLAQTVEKKLHYREYIRPVLVGYSSGATLVYAALAQAEPGTFVGAFSMGFCPDLPLTRPLCSGYDLRFGSGPKGKGYTFLPADKLQQSWVALQGTLDLECLPAATEHYVKEVNAGSMILLPGVGHGFYFPNHWGSQFQKAFERIAERQDTAGNLASAHEIH